MESHLKEITEDVESGEYFKDARDWYQKKYLFPVTERAYLVLLTSISIVISITAIIVLINFLPLKTKVPVVVEVEDFSEDYAYIERLRDPVKDADPNIALAKSLLEGFIEAFESYDYENNFQKLKRNKKFVNKFSSSGVSDKYRKYISTRNPDSLTLRYRKQTKRDIGVIKSSFVVEKSGEFEKYTAFVNFMSYESNIKGTKEAKWKAKIDFQFSDVKYSRDKEEFFPLNFEVTGYQASEIK